MTSKAVNEMLLTSMIKEDDKKLLISFLSEKISKKADDSKIKIFFSKNEFLSFYELLELLEASNVKCNIYIDENTVGDGVELKKDKINSINIVPIKNSVKIELIILFDDVYLMSNSFKTVFGQNNEDSHDNVSSILNKIITSEQ